MQRRPAIRRVWGVKASLTLALAQSRMRARPKMTAAMIANIEYSFERRAEVAHKYPAAHLDDLAKSTGCVRRDGPDGCTADAVPAIASEVGTNPRPNVY
jgi:hypothetical protein